MSEKLLGEPICYLAIINNKNRIELAFEKLRRKNLLEDKEEGGQLIKIHPFAP